MGHLQDDLHGWVEEHVAADNGDGHALNDVCGILHATVDTLLSALTNAVHVVILKPVDV